MNILVLNGSPKGKNGVTMQYVAFLQKKFSQHNIASVDVAQRIRQLEDDAAAFQDVVGQIRRADGVIWAFPVYFLLVAAQYKRFIELIHERKVVDVFRGKYAAALTTSIHFFDHTAHNYINAVAEDLGMNYYGGYSAEMRDLFKAGERDRLYHFMDNFLAAIGNRRPTAKVYPPVRPVNHTYVAGQERNPVDCRGKKIVVVTDATAEQTNLNNMIAKYISTFDGQIDVVNLHAVDIKGGCLGCIKCGYDNICVYTGKDGFIDFYDSKIKTADIIIMAGAIQDRYLSSRWKTYFDRSFYNNHVPTLRGKQLGYIISGPLAQLANLRQILEAYAELQQANLVNIVTDEPECPEHIDALLEQLAALGVEYASRHYVKPPTFFSVAGHKLFRDAVWGCLRFPFVADHRYYQQHGLYDFPHREYGMRLQSMLLCWAARIPAIRKELYGDKMLHHMTAPYRKLLARPEICGENSDRTVQG